VKGANPGVWEVLSLAGYLPVLACLAVGEDGQIYNVNADQAAVACAVHWKADCLVFLTDVDGVQGANGQTLARLTGDQIPMLIASGVATGGMQAKLNAIGEALAQNVRSVFIVNGHREDSLDGAFDAIMGKGAARRGSAVGADMGTEIVASADVPA
jgi:acetylglutamate kinase